MTSSPEEIRHDIEQTRASLSQHVDELADQANPAKIVHRQVSRAKAAGTKVLDSILGAAEDTYHNAADGLQQVGEAAESKARQLGEAVEHGQVAVRRHAAGNPVAAGLVAFGVGLLVAAAFPATRKERELAASVKEQAEPLTEQVVATAQEIADTLSEPLGEAADSLKETLSDAAQHVTSEGKSAVEEVRQQASDAASTVRDAADTTAGKAPDHRR